MDSKPCRAAALLANGAARTPAQNPLQPEIILAILYFSLVGEAPISKRVILGIV
jgi:hypothetical protein